MRRKYRPSAANWALRSATLGAVVAMALWVNSGKAVPVDMAPPGKVDRVAMAKVSGTRRGSAIAAEQDVASLLNIRAPMAYGQFVWNEEGVARGPTWVRVDLKRQLLSVFRSGHEIGTSVILYGTPEKPTPIGRFTVLAKRKDHRSSLYDADMPYTLRLTSDGISIHGSDVRPRTGTHGCVGVPLEFARRLFEQSEVGDDVTIIG